MRSGRLGLWAGGSSSGWTNIETIKDNPAFFFSTVTVLLDGISVRWRCLSTLWGVLEKQALRIGMWWMSFMYG